MSIAACLVHVQLDVYRFHSKSVPVRVPLFVVTALLVAGCTAESTSPTTTALSDAHASIAAQPNCHAGFCVPPEDPDPDAPGIWIATTVTGSTCFSGEQTDADQDGLSDFCEANIAKAFEPELIFGYNDDVTREPRWAAQPVGPARVEILDMLSYHRDNGNASAWCSVNSGWCSGHLGDSEVIALFVDYDFDTEHWTLVRACYSQHNAMPCYETAGSYPAALEYVSSAGGRPRAYVSIGKHANSATYIECEAGGPLSLDECSLDYSEPLGVYSNANVGSNGHHFIDCVSSYYPLYAGNGQQECYWSGSSFGGWIGANPEPTTPNSQRLAFWGFL